MNSTAVSRLFILTSALIWGSSFIAQILGMEFVGPITFISVRYIIGTASVLLMTMLLDYRKKHRDNLSQSKEDTVKEWLAALPGGICCGFFLFSATCLQQSGLQQTPAGKAAFLTAMYIVIVPILELFMGKRIGLKTWAAILTSSIGIYLLSISESFSVEYGDLLVLAATLFWALHIICSDKFSKKHDPLKLSACQFAFTAAASTTAMFIFESPTIPGIISTLPPAAYAGIMCTGVAYTLQMSGQRHLSPVEVSLILSTESLFALAGGIFVLGESLTGREILGCAILFAAVTAAQIPDKRGIA